MMSLAEVVMFWFRLAGVLLAAVVASGCADTTCSEALGYDGHAGLAADRACRKFVNHGWVSWDEIRGNMERREWVVHEPWEGFEGVPDKGEGRAGLKWDLFTFEFRFREFDGRDPQRIMDEVAHEVGHAMLVIARVSVEAHHPIIASVL